MSHWFHDASDSERQVMLDDAQQAVRDASAEMIKAHKARKPDQREGDYRAWKAIGAFCVPLVQHSTRATTIEVSTDGGNGRHAFLNPLKLSIQPESDGDLLLVVIERKYAAWVRDKPRVNLFGVPPDLVGEWSEEQRKKWSELRETAWRVNSRIDNANYRWALTRRSSAA